MGKFLKEFNTTLPNSFLFRRKYLPVKKIIPQCIEKGFTDLIIVNEDRGIPSKYLRFHRLHSILKSIIYWLPDKLNTNFKARALNFMVEICFKYLPLSLLRMKPTSVVYRHLLQVNFSFLHLNAKFVFFTVVFEIFDGLTAKSRFYLFLFLASWIPQAKFYFV